MTVCMGNFVQFWFDVPYKMKTNVQTVFTYYFYVKISKEHYIIGPNFFELALPIIITLDTRKIF